MSLFSTKNANEIQNKDDSGNKYMEAGIQENVYSLGSRTETSINGNTFIEFKFEKDGKIATHTEWEPNRKTTPNPMTGLLETEVEYQTRVSKQVKRILQVLSPFYSDDELNFEGNSFKEFCNWVNDLLNHAPNRENKLLRVKLVYDAKGFVTLPKYAVYTFIESMDVEKSNIRKINGIDNFDRPVITADKEDTNSSSATNSGNDLPF